MSRLLLACLLCLPAYVLAAEVKPCLDCHRAGASEGLAPLLEGQHREYLQIQLTRFREHLRPSFPMTDLSQGLGDEVIEDLATTLASRPWQAYDGNADAASLERGAVLTERRDCRACHGPDLLGGGSIPRLAGQAAPYLGQQLLLFSSGERHHPPTGGGQRMQALEAAQAEDLAAWLANLRPGSAPSATGDEAAAEPTAWAIQHGLQLGGAGQQVVEEVVGQ